MLSVNSTPANATAFKGKPSAKDFKKAYKAMEEAHWHAIMSDTRISTEVKKNLLINKFMADFSQMNWFEKLKFYIKALCK